MRNLYASLIAFSGSIAILVCFQNCSGFSAASDLKPFSGLGMRTSACPQNTVLFSGVCRPLQSVSLSGSSVTTNTFPNFQKFVYSVTLPGPVNLAGLSGTVALESNSPSFTEALYTIGYSPSGSCPASGSEFPDYPSVFATMPDNKFINQYIIKAQGGHVEMPADYSVDDPVAVSGCLFVILDGSAGNSGTSDTMSVNLTMNYVGGGATGANSMLGLVNYEHFASPGAPFSSTNEYLEVNQISAPIHVTELVGSVSNAAFDFFNETPPSGAWNTENSIYLVRGCGGYSAGTFQDQDFRSQLPANAIHLWDFSGATSGRGVIQTSIAQPLDVDLHAGDCILQIIGANVDGSIDMESALTLNGAVGSNHPVIGNIDAVDSTSIRGWACERGVADSIQVQLYLNGVAYNTYDANVASEPAVATACAATGTAYRFSIPVAGDILNNHGGEVVTIYGLSSNAANNNALSGSAAFAIPGVLPAIDYGAVQANVDLSCDYFNPDAIKSLSADTIAWLGSIQPSGLTLHEQYLMARQAGYTGAFGAGQHLAWLAQDPARQAAFDAAVSAFANESMAPTWANRIQHNADRKAAGYAGVFVCGGDVCYAAGQCDNLGRRL